MEFFLPFLSLLTTAVGALYLWREFAQPYLRLRTWQDAAGACGLQVVWRSSAPELSVRSGPVAVTIETCGHKGRSTQIVVRVPGPPDFHQVSIHREPLVRRARDIEVGDPAFDSTFTIEGPMRLVLALLDAETRRLLVRVNAESRLVISTGMLQAEHMPDKKVPHVLPLLVDVGRRLAQPMDIPRRLAENAKDDPESGVRLQNLLLLIRELPEAPETREALRTACSDPSPDIRLRAAKALGAEGRDILLDLAESLVDDAVSAEAVSILDRELPLERTKAILDHALGRGLLKTARACLEALGRSGEPAAAEPPLLLALQREEASLRVAAANALGRVGSAEAVLPLKEAAERHWLDRELHQATRQAIAEIQSRLLGASPGQLSLAATEAGQLSLAQEAGRLSLTQEAGQLSLTQTELPLLPHVTDEPEQSAREEQGVRPV